MTQHLHGFQEFSRSIINNQHETVNISILHSTRTMNTDPTEHVTDDVCHPPPSRRATYQPPASPEPSATPPPPMSRPPSPYEVPQRQCTPPRIDGNIYLSKVEKANCKQECEHEGKMCRHFEFDYSELDDAYNNFFDKFESETAYTHWISFHSHLCMCQAANQVSLWKDRADYFKDNPSRNEELMQPEPRYNIYATFGANDGRC